METYGTLGEGSFCLDAEAGINALLNDASEFLQYARGVTGLLVESLHDDEIPDRQRVLLALGAIDALVVMGVQCASRAHQDGVGQDSRRIHRSLMQPSVRCNNVTRRRYLRSRP